MFIKSNLAQTSYILALSASSLQYSEKNPTFQYTGGSELYIQGIGFSAPDTSKNIVKVNEKICEINPKLVTTTKITCAVPESNIKGRALVTVTVSGAAATCSDSDTNCYVTYIRKIISVLPNELI